MQVSNKSFTFKNVIYIFLPLLLAFTLQYVTIIIDVIGIFVIKLLSDERTVSTRSIEVIISQAFNQPMNKAFISLIQFMLYLLCFSLWYYKAFCRNQTASGMTTKDEITPGAVISSSFKRVFDVGEISKNISKLIVFIITGISGQFLVDSLLAVLRPIFVHAFVEYDKLVSSVTGAGGSYLMWFSVIIIAPIAEEILFRGIILRYSEKCLITPFAVLFQGVLFGLYHGNIIQGIYAFILGSILGLITIKTSSLIPCIIIHISLNSSLLLVPEALFEDSISTILTMGISLMAFIAGICYICRSHKDINI